MRPVWFVGLLLMGALALACGSEDATPTVAEAGKSAGSPAAVSTPASATPTATAQVPLSPTSAATAVASTPTATPCPQHTVSPMVGALAANLGAAASRWNAWLGCTAFVVASGGGIPVDFAPAEIQDLGWGQYAGGAIYLMPPSMPPADDPSTPYANDFERLTCVVMHAFGHVLGYADGASTAPKIMRPLDWPTWPPTSCSTPDSP